MRESFEYQGQYFTIPRTSIRPVPVSHLELRLYGSANSPGSAELLAGSGLGLLIVMHNEWSKAAHEVYDFHQMTMAGGHTPRPPIISTNISCVEMHEEATARDVERLGRKWDSVANDNCFSDDSLASVKRYKAYGRIGCADAKMGGQMHRDKMTDTHVKIQIVGTLDVSRQQITQLRQYTGLDHLVCEFGYGGLSHREAELNLRLFADRAMPVL